MAKAKRAELPELLADFSPDIVELSHDSFPSYELRSYQIPPARAIPIDRFIFSQQSKSQLGWDFIGLIETGRYKEYVDPAPVGSAARSVTEAFWAELRAIEFAVREGPGRSIRWGTPAGRVTTIW